MPKHPPYGRAGSKVRLALWIISQADRIAHTRWGELFAGTCAVRTTYMYRDSISAIVTSFH